MSELRVDLNCDLGEYDAGIVRAAAHDESLMHFITSANIACGGHAGDHATMAQTLAAAVKHGVAPGAHPGFADRAHFGRRPLPLTPGEVHQLVTVQTRALAVHAFENGAHLTHVKPHGALYNMAAADVRLARAVAAAVRDLDPELILFGLAGSALIAESRRIDLRAAEEAFADRSYEADGSLTPRTVAGAVIADPEHAADRVVRMVRERVVACRQGHDIPIAADTVCIHGDTPDAPAIVRAVRHALERAGVRVVAAGAA
jgi:5-oxoprolinase (ATP-hydrolysing) subunit A